MNIFHLIDYLLFQKFGFVNIWDSDRVKEKLGNIKERSWLYQVATDYVSYLAIWTSDACESEILSLANGFSQGFAFCYFLWNTKIETIFQPL